MTTTNQPILVLPEGHKGTPAIPVTRGSPFGKGHEGQPSVIIPSNTQPLIASESTIRTDCCKGQPRPLYEVLDTVTIDHPVALRGNMFKLTLDANSQKKIRVNTDTALTHLTIVVPDTMWAIEHQIVDIQEKYTDVYVRNTLDVGREIEVHWSL